MSKVYDYSLEMEELSQDMGWQEYQEEIERLQQEEFDQMLDLSEKKVG